MAQLGKRMLKITIVGASKAGKTALTVRFLTGKFIFEYASGHDIIYKHNFIVSSTEIPLQIVDTSCNENISDAIYGSDGIIIVYAIDNHNSFKRAEEILSDVKELRGKSPCAALVGNKSDLWPHKSVEAADGKFLADKYQCKYFEMSALRCKHDVLDMFSSLINTAVERVKSRSRSLPVVCKIPLIITEERQRSNSFEQLTKNKRSNSLKSLVDHLPTKQKKDKNRKVLHKTIGEMGHFAFTAIALPGMPMGPPRELKGH